MLLLGKLNFILRLSLNRPYHDAANFHTICLLSAIQVSLFVVIGASPLVGLIYHIVIPFWPNHNSLIVKGSRLVKLESFDAILFCYIRRLSNIKKALTRC
jgi:hypothetical protein